MARFQQGVHSPQRVLGPASGTEAVAVLGKLRLEDRFQYVPQRGLHHAVAYRGDAQRPLLLAAGLGNPNPPYGLRTILPVTQLRVQPGQLGFGLPGKMRHGLSVRPRAPALAHHLFIGTLQVRRRIGLVPQSEPDPVC